MNTVFSHIHGTTYAILPLKCSKIHASSLRGESNTYLCTYCVPHNIKRSSPHPTLSLSLPSFSPFSLSLHPPQATSTTSPRQSRQWPDRWCSTRRSTTAQQSDVVLSTLVAKSVFPVAFDWRIWSPILLRTSVWPHPQPPHPLPVTSLFLNLHPLSLRPSDPTADAGSTAAARVRSDPSRPPWWQ